MAKIIGIGGFFLKCKNPSGLANWYSKTLGLTINPGSTASILRTDPLPKESFTFWSVFDENSDYFEPCKKRFMINFIVDDLIESLVQVKKGGGEVLDDVQEHEYGMFGWFIDPEGNKVELWQPK